MNVKQINEEIVKMSDLTTSTIHMEYIMPWKGLSVNQKRLGVNIFIISGLDKLRTVFGRFQFINTEDKVCKGLEQGVDNKGSVTDSHDIKLALKIKLV